MLDKNEVHALAVKALDDNKAVDISDLDVTSLTDVTDHVIICSATSSRHAASLADKLIREMKSAGVKPLGVEGQKEGEWILIDLADVVVHIMLPDAREFYDLENLWTITEQFREKHEN